MEQWQTEMTALETWLEEVDVFVCSETPAVGDFEVLEAQLEQSNVRCVKSVLILCCCNGFHS